jgi:hypothetical protein
MKIRQTNHECFAYDFFCFVSRPQDMPAFDQFINPDLAQVPIEQFEQIGFISE